MPKLEDDSLMPFGKFKGQPMSEVPAYYLCWLWNDGLDRMSDVGLYVKENMDVLKSECKKEWDDE